MRKILYLIILLSIAGCTAKPPVTPPPSNCKSAGYEYDLNALTYQLVWSDEFDVDGKPDPQKWSYDVGGNGWGNRELQYYTNGDNVEIKDGKLIIEARQETIGPNKFTSTRLVSRNKGDWRYGKIEVVAKLPDVLGSWSAIWMLPTVSQYGGWPRSGEIDIMEYVVQDLDIIHGTVHTAKFNHLEGTQQGFSKQLSNVSETFNTFTIEWLPDQIRYYINGEYLYRFMPSLYLNCPTSQQWPFDIPFHLILNIAVGGNWGGARGVAEEGWPTTMEIDSIRVYQAIEMDDIIKNKK
jgi:beta-glucanase (GH16 family)